MVTPILPAGPALVYLLPLNGSRRGSRGNYSYELKTLYIHPDSLHLLEPQVGDLLSSGEEIRNSIAVATLSDLDRCGVGVIQRNGIAFHWPESEAA